MVGVESLPGKFARTNKGKIFRYANVENEVYKLILIKADYGYTWEKYWLSKDENLVLIGENITDVLKEGDYVNGKLIHKIDRGPSHCYLYYGNCKTLVDYQIETIVTKEDMERITYKENSRLWLQENIK